MNGEDQPIVDILTRLRSGDPKSVDDLLAHCRDRYRLLTHQMLGRFPGVRQWEETSDVLQNVLMRLDAAIRVLEVGTPCDLVRLVATLIRRELIDLSRHYCGPEGAGQNVIVVANLPQGQLPYEPSASEYEPLNLIQWSEFHTYIATLDEDSRRLFDLLYYQGIPQPQAAKMLNISLGTLKREWQQVRFSLASSLGDRLPT